MSIAPHVTCFIFQQPEEYVIAKLCITLFYYCFFNTMIWFIEIWESVFQNLINIKAMQNPITTSLLTGKEVVQSITKQCIASQGSTHKIQETQKMVLFLSFSPISHPIQNPQEGRFGGGSLSQLTHPSSSSITRPPYSKPGKVNWTPQTEPSPLLVFVCELRMVFTLLIG